MPRQVCVVNKEFLTVEALWRCSHGVSKAIDLADPDGNGIELHPDRSREQ